jgi:hypothetical protein
VENKLSPVEDEPLPAPPAAPWRTGSVLAVWLFVALVVVPSIGSIYFATGKVDVAAPLVCPRGNVRTHVETVITIDDHDTATNYYLDCLDDAGRAHRVPTLTLIGALYFMMAAPGVVVAFIVALVHWVSRGRRGSSPPNAPLSR